MNLIELRKELKRFEKLNLEYPSKRIVAEVNPDKICSANVDGGKKGKKWLVKLSNTPLEFID